MHDKLKVIATRDGRPGNASPEEVGEIDRDGFSWSGTTAHLSNESARQLLALFDQPVLANLKFHLLDRETLLEDCSISGRGATCTLRFMRATHRG
jgi:hypothetical protein